MELKTLKDLIKKVKIKAVIENTNKWGTIPMIQINNSSLVAEQITTEVDWIELKAEAIKWIKEIDNFEKLPEDIVWEKITGQTIEYSIDAMIGMRNWIKHFFNITEEDLQ